MKQLLDETILDEKRGYEHIVTKSHQFIESIKI